MLSMANTRTEPFLALFADIGVSIAFLVPTPTGLDKSIMDATTPLRALLRDKGLHDYSSQDQGPDNKVMINSFFITEGSLIPTTSSLYRPKTKQGDPRIWFRNLRQYSAPYDLLALAVINDSIYLFNLSNQEIARSLLEKQFAFKLLHDEAKKRNNVALELIEKLRLVRGKGFLPTITFGDPGVGDTLEHALGIERNNINLPDYKGIELKTMRKSKDGVIRRLTRTTLFSKVPDEGLSYSEIVRKFGKWQIPRGKTEKRLQLYDTLRASRENAYGLLLNVDQTAEKLRIMNIDSANKTSRNVSSWIIESLQAILLRKHPQTFWIEAVSEMRNGVECFRYDRVFHTKNPNASLFAPLIETDKITVDVVGHFRADNTWRDHGMLFKMQQQDLPLLFGDAKQYLL